MKDRILNLPLDRLKLLLDGIHRWLFLPPRAGRREVFDGDVFYVWDTPVLLMVCEVKPLSREDDMTDFPWHATGHADKAALWAALDAFAQDGETPPDSCVALSVHAQTLFNRVHAMRAVVLVEEEQIYSFLPAPVLFAWMGDLPDEAGRYLLEWRETPTQISETRRRMLEDEPLKPSGVTFWCNSTKETWMGEFLPEGAFYPED